MSENQPNRHNSYNYNKHHYTCSTLSVLIMDDWHVEILEKYIIYANILQEFFDNFKVEYTHWFRWVRIVLSYENRIH